DGIRDDLVTGVQTCALPISDGKPSYQMGGLWMMGFRAGVGYVVAIVAALFVEWQHRKYGNALLTPLAQPSGLPIVEANNNGKRRSEERRVGNGCVSRWCTVW